MCTPRQNVDPISVQPDPEVERQRSRFEALKGGLGEVSSADIDTILAVRVASALRNREVVSCEPELTTETIDRLRAELQACLLLAKCLRSDWLLGILPN
jgi:hypothetical protein